MTAVGIPTTTKTTPEDNSRTAQRRGNHVIPM
jgi:hypothetical protein